MSIIVDGYNFIGRSREFMLNDMAARDKVIYLMGLYCAKAKKTLTLVFDGNNLAHQVDRKRRYGRVMVIYTSPMYTADDVIKKMLKAQEPRFRKTMLIVSSDQEIIDFARAHDTPVMRSEEFEREISKLLDAPEQVDRVNVRVSDEEVQQWLAIFEKEAKKTPPAPARPQFTKPLEPIRHAPPPISEVASAGARAASPPKSSKRKPPPGATVPDEDQRENVRLSDQEVDEWLKIFGDAAKHAKEK